MMQYPYCQVITNDGGSFNVDPRHYEQLRDMLDRGDKGWVELDAHYDGACKIMLNIKFIDSLVYVTEQFERTRNMVSVTNV